MEPQSGGHGDGQPAESPPDVEESAVIIGTNGNGVERPDLCPPATNDPPAPSRSPQEEHPQDDPEDDDSMNKKPAAVDSDEESDISDSDSSSENNSDSDDSDTAKETATNEKASADTPSNDEEKPERLDADGRPLSEYEIQRLERIERNRQLLAQLGLQQKGGGGVLGVKTKKSGGRPRKNETPKSEQVIVERRKTMSRRSKLNRKSYKEPSKSVSHLYPKAPPVTKKAKTPERKPRSERMHHDVYQEFQKLQSRKRGILKQAEKNVRHATKELKYWQKRVAVRDRPIARKREDLREKNALEGKTAREFIHEVDERMPEIIAAYEEYEDNMTQGQKEKEREYQRLVADSKFKTLDALDRFPKAMKNAKSLLNSILLERAPKDPPPPRRSKRSVGAAEEEDFKPPSAKKPSARKQKKSATSEPTIDQHPIVDDATIEPLSADRIESSTERTAKNRTKRVSRNVGGWVSPEFSLLIDRSWLENSSTKNGGHDLSAHVPQPGETVLYYIAGHKLFLEAYPDILAKKTRTKSRVPLWERVVNSKKSRDKRVGESVEQEEKDVADCWWDDEWKNGDFDTYPILCRVERTHAEFPPDPWGKVVQNQGGSDGAKLYFKKPKGSTGRQARGKVPMRLAVELRPLLPLIPPCLTSSGGADTMSLPPSFTAVTFPCRELEPFLVPFTWAYSRTHSVQLNEKVDVADGEDGLKVRLDKLEGFVGRNAQQLDDRETELRAVVESYFDSERSLYSILDEEVAKTRLPIRDARVVLDIWRERVANAKSDIPATAQPRKIDFFTLLRSSMPLWQGATIMRDMWDRTKMSYSPWRLSPSSKKRGLSDPWSLGTHMPTLDESLSSKLRCILDDFVSNNQSSSQLFLEPITEDIAPSYYCAVPIGMCLAKIKERLKSISSKKSCFYRTIGALQLDISSLLECCLLYNSPESEVVVEAFAVVSELRDSVERTVQYHNREVKEALKVDEERRRLLRGHSTSTSEESSSGPLIPGTIDLRKPTKGPVSSDWLESTCETLALQTGDTVLYCRKLHQDFVEGHYRSLDSFQCVIPPLDSIIDGEKVNNEWVPGKVMWTRAAFPKSLLKLSADDAYTFPTSTTLQCLGIQFHSEKVIPIYWCPCFATDSQREAICERCSIPYKTSFIHHVEQDSSHVKIDESIGQIFHLLKTRCAQQIIPSVVDEGLTRASVQAGYIPRRPDVRDSLFYPELFVETEKEMPRAERSHAGTRKKKSNKQGETLIDNPELSNLVRAGFLPEWLLTSRTGNNVGFQVPADFKSIFAVPKLCFELIISRVHENYYRQKEAIENDLVEGYISVVSMMLYQGATRKKSPLSIKRLARLMNSKTQNSEASAVNEEETLWLERLRYVRELFAVALVTVSDTSQVQRVFALSTPLPPKPPQTCVHDPNPVRFAAGEKLSRLVEALSRDKCTNIFNFPSGGKVLPVFKLSVKSGGKPLTLDRDILSVTRASFIDKEGSTKKLAVTTQKSRVACCRTVAEPSPQVGKRKLLAEAPILLLGGNDYEGNEDLSRFLFQRPSRMRPCVRCRSYRRSMLSCRVMRKHSNRDYDWVNDFGGGSQYLSRLLSVLKTGDTDASGSRNPDLLTAFSDTPAGRTQDAAEEQEPKVDPKEYLKMAEDALDRSNKILPKAQLFAGAPNRLSKECISKTFPIDEEDGHYLFCVVCGLSGDLLCCDGCPNVVHVNCIALSDLPEGDWFCEDCQETKHPLASPSFDNEKGKSPVSFRRTEFDENDLAEATNIIERLQLSRPTQRVRTKDRPQDRDEKEASDSNNDVEEVVEANIIGPPNRQETSKTTSQTQHETTPNRSTKRRKPTTEASPSKRKRPDTVGFVKPVADDSRSPKRRATRAPKTSDDKPVENHDDALTNAASSPRSSRSRSKTDFFRPEDGRQDLAGRQANQKNEEPSPSQQSAVEKPSSSEHVADSNDETNEGTRRSKRVRRSRDHND